MKLAIIFSLFSVLLSPFFVFAESPSVSSFTASPTSFPSGYPVSFSWTLYNSGGYSLIVPCVSGIRITYTTGAAFPCGIPFTSLSRTSDSLTLQIHNISGGQKTVTARIIPKDAGGSDVVDAAKETSMAASPLADPIMSFTSSVSETEVGVPVTVSWISHIIDGVNISLECKSEIKVSSPSYTKEAFMPCGAPVFLNDLAPSGSLTMNFLNSSPNALPYAITLLPAIEPKVYDGARSKSLTLGVGSDILPDPEVLSFSSSLKRAQSGEEFALSWATKNAAGANLVFSCFPLVTATSSSDFLKELPCGENAFQKSMPPKGDIVLALTNTSNTAFDVTISLVPERKAGGYDATRQKQIKIAVEKKTAQKPATQVSPLVAPPLSPPPSPSAPPPQPFQPSAPATVEPPAPIPQHSRQSKQQESAASKEKPVSPPVLFSDTLYPKITLTQTLKKGSRGDEVTLLQKFLTSDTAIAPEKVITGYFGSLTEHAIQRFQEKYGITSEKNREEYGIAGAQTRAKIHALGGTKIPLSKNTAEEDAKETTPLDTSRKTGRESPQPSYFSEEQEKSRGKVSVLRGFLSYTVRLIVNLFTDYLSGAK